MELPAAARKVVDLTLAMMEHINEELAPIEKELRAYARSQAGRKALMMAHYGVGKLTPAWRCFRNAAIPDASRVRRRRCAMLGWT
jgi:hypothetical protein